MCKRRFTPHAKPTFATDRSVDSLALPSILVTASAVLVETILLSVDVRDMLCGICWVGGPFSGQQLHNRV